MSETDHHESLRFDVADDLNQANNSNNVDSSLTSSVFSSPAISNSSSAASSSSTLPVDSVTDQGLISEESQPLIISDNLNHSKVNSNKQIVAKTSNYLNSSDEVKAKLLDFASVRVAVRFVLIFLIYNFGFDEKWFTLVDYL